MAKPKALLHACCAPCATYPAAALAAAGWEPVLHFCNPNIHPESERARRLEELRTFGSSSGLGIIVDEAGADEWEQAAGALGPGPEGGPRCLECFRLRLLWTARAAAGLGIQAFSTTLTVSPHKNAGLVLSAGREAALAAGAAFLDFDFRKGGGFGESVRISRKLGLFRQDYCGCRFSMDVARRIRP